MSILKNTVLAGIGFASLTKQKAEELVDTLIKTGELSKSEKKTAVLELLAKAEAGAKDATSKVSQEVEKAIHKVKVSRQSDIDKLSDKMDKLTKVVENLEKKLGDHQPEQ